MTIEHDDDVRVVATGHFKLDRSRAMDKLAHFQLADHRQYVAELVAAAVCAGATEVIIHNDADDFEVEWDGAHPDLADLDGFFDALFYRGADPLQRMVQHLAQGVLGAVGLDPRWVRLHRPGLSLDLTDPRSPISTENDRTHGVRVEVRERFTFNVMREFGRKAFADLEETTWLRERAVGCPIPVEVNGTALVLDVEKALNAPAEHREPITDPQGRFSGRIWWADGTDPLVLIRDGIVAERTTLHIERCVFAGWVRCDALELDASRAKVSRDALWTTITEAIQAAIKRLLVLETTLGVLTADQREAAVSLLGGLDCPLAGVPLFDRLDGTHRYALSQLAHAPRALVTTHTDLYDPGLDLPQIQGDTKLVHLLDQWLPDKVSLGTHELRQRQEGRLRVAALQATAVPLAVKATYARTFEREGVRMALGLGLPDASWEGTVVELRIDGLTLERVPGRRTTGTAAVVRVEATGLEPSLDWSSAGPAPLKRQLVQQAEAWLQEHIPNAARQHPHHNGIRALTAEWLDIAVRAHRGAVDNLPTEVRTLPFFTTGHGTRWSLGDVDRVARAQQRLDNKNRPIIWVVPATEPTPDPTDQVLHVDETEDKLLRSAFQGRVERVGRRLADQRIARQRRSEALARRTEPHFSLLTGVHAVYQEAFQLPDFGLHGVLGLQNRDVDTSPVAILRDHVVLGTLDLPIHLPGATAVLSWDHAEPTADWSGLADPETTAFRLAEYLEPVLVRFAKETALALGVPPTPMPRWWQALLARGPKQASELSTLPFIRDAAGNTRSLADLLAHKARGSRAGRIRWVPPHTEVPEEVNRDYLIATPDQVRILELWLGARFVQRGIDALRDLLRTRERFYRSPVRPFAVPMSAVAEVEVKLADYTLRLGLDGSPHAKPGLVLDLRVDQRDLERVHRRSALPWVGVVQGPAVRPNPSYQAIEDRDLSRRIFDEAKKARELVLQRLASLAGTGENLRRTRLRVWFQLHRNGLRWLGATERNNLHRQLHNQPLVEDAAGGVHTVAQLQVAHAQGNLYVLSRNAGPVPMPADHIWVEATGRDREMLAAVAGSKLPSADRVVAELRQGAERRAGLRPEPLTPSGHYPLSSTVDLPGGGRAWVGLVPGRPGSCLLRVDRRPVAEEPLPEAHGVRVVVEHDDIEANRTFDRWASTDLARRTRREAVDAIGTVLAQGLAIPMRLGGPADATIDAALHFRSLGGQVDVEQGVLAVSHGPPLTFSDLQRLARQGPIRFAPTGTKGRPLSDANPVFVGDADRRAALATWGKVEDATEALAREQAAWDRRSAPRQSFEKPTGALFCVPVPAPATGALWATLDPSAEVLTVLDGRPLEGRKANGPIPLVGYITHPDLQPDPWFQKAQPDELRAKLAGAVHQASENALALALQPDATEEPVPDVMLLRALLRTFARKYDIRKATGTHQRLAQRPLFLASGDRRLSLLDLTRLPQSPRWVGDTRPFESLTPARPFVSVQEAFLADFIRLVGGTDSSERAREEHQVARNQKQAARPFQLPPGDWLTTAEGKQGDLQWMAGLAEDWTTPGHIELRLRGVPVHHQESDRRGLHLVIELDPSTDPLAPPKALPKGFSRALRTIHRRLVMDIGPAAVDGHHRLSRFCTSVKPAIGFLRKDKVPGQTHPSRVWLDLDVLHTTEGRRSVADLAERLRTGTTLVWGSPEDTAPSGVCVLIDSPTQRAIAEAVEWDSRISTIERWRHLESIKHQEALQAAAEAERTSRLERARSDLEPELHALVPWDQHRTELIQQALQHVTPEDNISGRPQSERVLHAWRLLDPLVQSRLGAAGVVDLARHLARRLTEVRPAELQ